MENLDSKRAVFGFFPADLILSQKGNTNADYKQCLLQKQWLEPTLTVASLRRWQLHDAALLDVSDACLNAACLA